MSVDYLYPYVAEAPMSFALCRAVECKVLSRTRLDPPILDLGCGDGLFARIFFGGKAVAVGIDLSFGEARKAKSTGNYDEVVLAAGGTLPFATGSFESILSNSVLEHIFELPVTIGECFRVLRPGGRMAVTVPLTQSNECFYFSNLLRRLGAEEAAVLYAKWKHRVWRNHNVFDEAGWISLMEEAGFEIDEVHLFNSKSTLELADLLFPLSPPGVLFKRLFGRMVIRPVFWSRMLARGLRGVYERDGSGERPAGTLCLVARKRSGAIV